jgi:glycosyltransferase involved in cell wall biosynthesis
MGRLTKHKRLRIGLIFTGSSDWVGGLYYIHNIIRSLNKLPEEKKPYLLLIPDWKTPLEYISTFNYPYAEIFSLDKRTLLNRAYYKMFTMLTSKNLFYDWMIRNYDLEWFYPFHDFRKELDSFNDKKISWIYDLQHRLLPELFDKEELLRRETEFSLITSKSKCIVVSSHDSEKHLRYFYPEMKAVIKVLQFVSIIDHIQLTPFTKLEEKYLVEKPYFIISNQFWQHKNHVVVLNAIKLLKEKNREVKIIFTGKESDHRNPEYVRSLKAFVENNGLNKNVKFLGFIPREDQLGLMNQARAVIQPSKFEGWGTVVEDAKTLQKPVILSDINVHREQVGDHGYYFPVDGASELAGIIEMFGDAQFKPILPEVNHEERLQKFAEDFIKIFDCKP